ncbi:MAG: TolC family protein [Caulobacteraceae bacterium]|nr:TolC family protein [Caulobacteraceae bacterium]
MKATTVVSAALSALLLAGCAVGPNYQKPDLALTAAYHTPPPAPVADAGQASLSAWWRGFGDPELTRVVERAGAQNLDLEQARERILQSRAVAHAAGAALLPQGQALASAAHEEQSLLSPIGEIGRHLPGYERQVGLYDVGAAASWEIDLFGGLRREREAARAGAKAAAADAEAVRISVMAEAADAYLEARADQGRLAVARRQEQVELDLVALLEQRAAQGVSPDRELREARAELDGVRAGIPPLKAGLETQLNRLDVLMGAQPGTYRAELTAEAPLPVPPALAAGDGPAELLRRRPDIIAAEQRLVAANARIGAAISDYYPKVSISGLLGFESVSAGQLFTGDALQHQISGGLRWRLFDFGRINAEVAQARGAEAEALAGYRAVALRATEEVEDSFSDLTQAEARADALDRQIAELSVARGQAELAYQGGVASLVEVRDADRELLNASDQLVQAKAGADLAAVSAFRALGGGWTPDAGLLAQAPAPHPKG